MAMRWLAEITGDPGHLRDLAEAFPAGDLRLEETDTGWVMSGDSIASAISANEALSRAQELLPRLNGLGRAKLPGFTPIVLSQRVRDADDPEQRTAVFAEAHLHAYGTLTVGGPPSEGIRHLDSLLDADPALAEAIRLLGASPEVDWFVLYKVYEVLKTAAGDASAFRQRVGITKDQLSAFTYSANSAAASGDDARHASGVHGKSNQRPLTLREGQEFINRVIAVWPAT